MTVRREPDDNDHRHDALKEDGPKPPPTPGTMVCTRCGGTGRELAGPPFSPVKCGACSGTGKVIDV